MPDRTHCTRTTWARRGRRWELSGEAFGASAPNEDPDGDGQRLPLDLRFPSQRHDPATGLHENHHRDDDPNTGRYLQSDPIGIEGGINTYAYVEGNPLRFIDPYGLVRWSGTVIFGGGGGGGVGGGIARFNLQSECLYGQQASVKLDFYGAGISVGSPLSATVSKVELSGGNVMFVDPGELVGSASFLSLGVATGGGIALSSIKVGDVSSSGISGQGGWDAPAAYLFGISRIAGGDDSISWNECGCR